MSSAFSIDLDGLHLSGRKSLPSRHPVLDSPPLIVALHGGGFTSAYFDSGAYSLMDRAAAAGCPSVALDRPGYGSSTRLAEGDEAILRNAEVLQAAIGDLWRNRDFDAVGVVLLGHSVGGGIANIIASERPDWPLLGIAVSGILAGTPTGIPPFWEEMPPSAWIETPFDFRLGMMFGPADSYAPGAPELSETATAPLWTREAIEMFSIVPGRLRNIAAKIDVPVLIHSDDLAAFRGNGEDELARLANCYVNAPSVTTSLVPNAGHCIDFHLAGAAYQKEQVDFAVRCAESKSTA